MTEANIGPSAESTAVIEAQLAQHGIVRVPADSFTFGSYRYSNPRDAIAAAERSARTANDA
jgi:hypothetical protein